MKNTHFIYIVMLFLILSCNKNIKHDLKTKVISLKHKKSLKIKIPENIYYHSFLNQITKEKNKTILLRKRTHTNDNGIDIINLNDNKFIKSVILSNEGPNGIDTVRGFYYINKDSIIFLGTKDIIIYNSNLNKVIYRDVFSKNYMPIGVSNITKPFYKKNELYFSKHKFLPPTSNKFFDANILVKYNLKKHLLFEIENTKFSKKYLNKCWSHYDIIHPFTIKENKIIQSFAIDDSLYILDLKSNHKKAIYAKSVYKSNEVSDLNCSEIKKKETNQKYTNFYYNSIIYDMFHDIYYRISLIPINNFDKNKKYKRINRQFIISVLDSNFNTIGESDILNKNNKYIYFDWFIDEKGLWISSNNPNYKLYDEDYLTYQLFRYESK